MASPVVLLILADGAVCQGGDHDRSRRCLAGVTATVGDFQCIWIGVQPLNLLLCLAAVVVLVGAAIVAPAIHTALRSSPLWY